MSPTRPAILLMNDSLSVGGTEGQFVEVVCRLDRSRWNVHVTCLRAEGPLRERLEAAHVPVWSCGKGSFKSPAFLVAIWKLARYFRIHAIRIVHCFDYYSNVLGVPAARLAGVPVIIASQRDMGDVRSGPQRLAQHFVLGLATTVLVNADAIRERLVMAKILSADRIVVLRNGTDITRFSLSSQHRQSGSPFLIGTLSNLRPEKGLDDLLRASKIVCQIAPAARFVLWGDGPCRQRLESLARQLEVDHLVTFAGRISRVQDALRDCSIFAFAPTRNEGLSNALLEAMATGLPVVATRCGGNAELVEDGRTGLLVPPEDPNALASAIVRLIEDPGFAAQLAARGRERVHANFTLDHMLARIENLYNRLLDEAAH